MRRRLSIDGRLLLGYAALQLLFWWPILLGGRTLWFDDTNHWYFPIRELVFSALRSGRIPLWTDLIGAGYPILAEGQAGAWYPGQFLFWLLPTIPALSWTVALHGWLGAALTHGYLRRLGARPAAAATGAIAFAFSGAFVGHLVYLPMAFSLIWLPGLCWALEHGLQTRRWSGFGYAAMALAMSLTAVHAQMAAYVAMTGLAYGVIRALQLRTPLIWTVSGLAGLCVLAGLLAAGQLLPLAELLSQTERGAGLNRRLLLEYGLTPMWVLFEFMPRFFGHPTQGNLHWAGLTVTWELNAFFGVTAAVLALLCPLLTDRREARSLAVIWWLTFILAWGRATPLFELLHSLPILQSFRIPSRWLVPGTFAGAALAGLAVDAVLADPEAVRQRLRRALPVGIIALAAVMSAAYLALSWGRSIGKVGPAELRQAVLAAVGCGVTWYAALVLPMVATHRPKLIWLLPAILMVELYAAQHDFNPVAPPTVFQPNAEPQIDPAVAEVKAGLGPGERVFVPPYTTAHPFLKPSSNVLVGIPSLDNFAPLRLARIDRLLNQWKAEVQPAVESDPAPPDVAERMRVLRLLRVRYLDGRYGPDGAGDLYRLPGELQWEAWRGDPAADSPVPIDSPTPARRNVTFGGRGGVFVNQVAYPGWRAVMPGGWEHRVLAGGLFPMVDVEEYGERFTMVYDPLTLRLGLFLSLLTCAGLLAVKVARW